MSRVDVIVPCYKYGQYLRQCVESVLSQQGVEVRVLILDDASPDNTPEVAAELAKDPRVEYRRHAFNRGHVATYNEGLEWLEGDYALLLSADDLLTAGALGRAARLLDAHPEVGLTYGRQIIFRADQSLPALAPDDGGWEILSGAELLAATCADAANIVNTATAVVRTALQKKIGGYRKELPHSCDMEMWLRFAAHAAVGVIHAEQAFYRRHGENMSIRLFGTALADFRQRQAAFMALFQEFGNRIAGADKLQRTAAEKLAEQAFWAAHAAFDKGDTPSCKAFLDFAAQTWPDLRSRRVWSHLRWKQFMGPRAWSVLRVFVDWVRRRRAG